MFGFNTNKLLFVILNIVFTILVLVYLDNISLGFSWAKMLIVIYFNYAIIIPYVTNKPVQAGFVLKQTQENKYFILISVAVGSIISTLVLLT